MDWAARPTRVALSEAERRELERRAVNLQRLKEASAALADPRRTSPEAAEQIIAVFWMLAQICAGMGMVPAAPRSAAMRADDSIRTALMAVPAAMAAMPRDARGRHQRGREHHDRAGGRLLRPGRQRRQPRGRCRCRHGGRCSRAVRARHARWARTPRANGRRRARARRTTLATVTRKARPPRMRRRPGCRACGPPRGRRHGLTGDGGRRGRARARDDRQKLAAKHEHLGCVRRGMSRW